MPGYISGLQLKKYLIKSIVEDFYIQDNAKYKVQNVDATQLMSPGRIDFLAKWLYTDHYVKGIKSSISTKLYTETIRAITIGRFFDRDNIHKNSPERFTESFNKVIDAMVNDTFDPQELIVPVNTLGVVLDGAHRTAASSYFGKNIKAASLESRRAYTDAILLKKRGMPPHLIDNLVNIANLAIPGIKSLVLLSGSKSSRKQITALLQNNSALFYTRSISLSSNGLANFMMQLGELGHEIDKKALNGSFTIHLYLFKPNDNISSRTILEEIRDDSHLSSHTYITKTQQESLYLGNLLLNRNSLHLMNHANPNHLIALRKFLDSASTNKDSNYILDSSATFIAYGMKDTSMKVTMLHNDNHTLDNLVYNPENNMYLGDIRLIAPLALKQLPEDISKILPVDYFDGYARKRKIENTYITMLSTIRKVKCRAQYETRVMIHSLVKRLGLLPLLKRLRHNDA